MGNRGMTRVCIHEPYAAISLALTPEGSRPFPPPASRWRIKLRGGAHRPFSNASSAGVLCTVAASDFYAVDVEGGDFTMQACLSWFVHRDRACLGAPSLWCSDSLFFAFASTGAIASFSLRCFSKAVPSIIVTGQQGS